MGLEAGIHSLEGLKRRCWDSSVGSVVDYAEVIFIWQRSDLEANARADGAVPISPGMRHEDEDLGWLFEYRQDIYKKV